MRRRILGVLILLSGLFLLYSGYQESQTAGDEAKHFFTGEYRDRTYWLLGGGLLLTIGALVGLLVPLKRRPLLS